MSEIKVIAQPTCSRKAFELLISMSLFRIAQMLGFFIEQIYSVQIFLNLSFFFWILFVIENHLCLPLFFLIPVITLDLIAQIASYIRRQYKPNQGTVVINIITVFLLVVYYYYGSVIKFFSTGKLTFQQTEALKSLKKDDIVGRKQQLRQVETSLLSLESQINSELKDTEKMLKKMNYQPDIQHHMGSTEHSQLDIFYSLHQKWKMYHQNANKYFKLSKNIPKSYWVLYQRIHHWADANKIYFAYNSIVIAIVKNRALEIQKSDAFDSYPYESDLIIDYKRTMESLRDTKKEFSFSRATYVLDRLEKHFEEPKDQYWATIKVYAELLYKLMDRLMNDMKDERIDVLQSWKKEDIPWYRRT